jgi:hypothetical protein
MSTSTSVAGAAAKATFAPNTFQVVDQAKSGMLVATQVRGLVLAQPAFV